MSAGRNIVEVIRTETASRRRHTAIVDGPVELTYAELLERVEKAAAGLEAAGIQPLERVAFLCEDSADYVVGSLAVLRRGAVVVPVSPSLMGDELESILDRMDVNVLLFDAAIHRRARSHELPAAPFCVRRFRWCRRQARNDQPDAYARLNPAFIRFSSGTTGASKGVLLSHETIIARTDAADRGLRITERDVIVWVLSMSFHFVVSVLLYLRRGATMLICRQPFPESFLEAIRRRTGTVLYASPFHYHVLATSPLVPGTCLAGVRLAISTAMKLPAATAEAFAAKFGIELAEAYGIIEVGLPFLNARGGHGERGCVGRAQPGYEIRIVAPDREGRGGIRIRGPGLFDAYVSPWKSREEILADGWFNTGDVGRLDASGNLFILGREKNVINFVGMKIFPDEVEEVLNNHPAIAESLVYGEPHPYYGQIPCARIVLKAGAKAADAAALRRYCFERLAPHKVPKAFETVERLPRTGSGKLKRG